MYINAYTLSYGNWTVIPSQWETSFKEMKDCGFNSVSLSFSESEFTYARRTIELQIKMAHEYGLEVWLVPSRLGGRVAGAPFMQSNWLLKNPMPLNLTSLLWDVLLQKSSRTGFILYGKSA